MAQACLRINKKFVPQAAKVTTDKSIQLMVDLEVIQQETNTGESTQRTREQDSRDLLKISLVDSSTEAESANKDQKHGSKSTNKEG